MTDRPTYRLVVLRHAKAEAHGTGGDRQRPLALKGRRQATALGRGLRDAGIEPDVVLCSPALRTRQTWELAGAAGTGEPETSFPEELYDARVEDLLDLVNGLDDRPRTVLVVGHEPSVSALAGYLAGLGSDVAALAQVQVGVSTATYAVLESTMPWTQWRQGCAALVTVVPPPAD